MAQMMCELEAPIVTLASSPSCWHVLPFPSCWHELTAHVDESRGWQVQAGMQALKAGSTLKDKILGRPAEEGATVA